MEVTTVGQHSSRGAGERTGLSSHGRSTTAPGGHASLALRTDHRRARTDPWRRMRAPCSRGRTDHEGTSASRDTVRSPAGEVRHPGRSLVRRPAGGGAADEVCKTNTTETSTQEVS